MATPPVSDEEITRRITAYELHDRNQTLAAEALGISRYAIQHTLRTAAKRGLLGTKPVLPGYEISKTTAETNEVGEIVREFIQQRPAREEPYETPAGHVIKGISSLVDSQGNIIQQWIKTQKDKVLPDLIEAIKAAFEGYKGIVPLVRGPTACDLDIMSVYPIADQHNGLLAWGAETGESYDLKIGADLLRSCASRLIDQSPPSHEAVILNLGDWQHTDDQKNMTPRGGNLLDVDGRYFKVLTTGVQLMMDVVELALQKHNMVTVRNIPGNHDPHASIALTVALANAYSKNERVFVDDDPSPFWFKRFGQSLLGATHGHTLKPDKMAMAMAVLKREDWGNTRYHHFYFGHVHHDSAKEVGDVRVESFQSLAARDAYSVAGGYVSGRSLTSITFDREQGEVGRHRVNVPPPGAK
jgi:hypothetical protein